MNIRRRHPAPSNPAACQAVKPHAAQSNITQSQTHLKVAHVTSDDLAPSTANSVSRDRELSKANTHSLKPEPYEVKSDEPGFQIRPCQLSEARMSPGGQLMR